MCSYTHIVYQTTYVHDILLERITHLYTFILLPCLAFSLATKFHTQHLQSPPTYTHDNIIFCVCVRNVLCCRVSKLVLNSRFHSSGSIRNSVVLHLPPYNIILLCYIQVPIPTNVVPAQTVERYYDKFMSCPCRPIFNQMSSLSISTRLS